MDRLRFVGDDGAAANNANTGLDQVLVHDPGGSMVIDNSWQPRDSRASIVSTGSAQSGYVWGAKNIPNTTALAIDQSMIPVARSTAGETVLFWIGETAGDNRMCGVNTLSTGALRVYGDAGAVVSSPANIWRNGEEVVLSVFVEQHSTAGRLRVVLFEADGVTVRWDSGLFTGQNTGPNPYNLLKLMGAKTSSSATNAATIRYGEPRWQRGATGILQPPRPHRPFLIWDEVTSQWLDDFYVWDPRDRRWLRIAD